MCIAANRQPARPGRNGLILALGLAAAACGGGELAEPQPGTSPDASPVSSALPSPGRAPRQAASASLRVASPAPSPASSPLSSRSPPPVSAIAASPRAAAPAWVMVQGCVLDRHHIPTTDAPVRVLAEDGRLLGNAFSNRDGRFHIRLPAGRSVLMQIDRAQGDAGEPMRVTVDAASPTLPACLLDEQA